MINIYMIVFLLSVIIASFSQVILKISAKEKHENVIKEYINKYVIIGYFLMFLSSFLTTIAYKGIPLSYGPILNSLGYLVVGFFGWTILKEKITKRRTLGYIFIVLGVLITNL